MARKGRPAFKVTPALKRKVAELASTNMSQEDIGRAIGCTVPTLTKHFEEELTTGAAMKRAEVIGMLYRSARGGNTAAIKHLEALTRAGAAAQALRDRAQGDKPGTAAEEPKEKLGKKAAAKVAAANVEGTFAPPPAPRLVVSNT